MLKRVLGQLWRMTKTASEAGPSKESADAALHKVQTGRVDDQRPSDSVERPKYQRVKTQKYAMLLGYQGKDYYGMQVQKDGLATIEGEVLDAFLKLGWITPELRRVPFDFFFQRAARTDRAVSAVRQVISAQMPKSAELPENGAAAMNSVLPPAIRVFGFRRTTTSFHSQKNCDYRTYSYTLPTFAFAKPDELTTADFRISQKTVEQVNGVLSQYKGTHNFYNYTSKRSFEDRSSFRYIIAFDCGEPFIHRDELRQQDVEFITCKVIGQSFMLHQIRKMMGMAIAVIREVQHRSAIQKSFVEKERMDVPRAPGLGLLLERIHYEKYDRTFGNHPPHLPLTNWSPEIESTIERFRKEHILNEILDEEIRSQSMLQWLSGLSNHDFLSSDDESCPKQSFVAMAAATAKKAEEAARPMEAAGEMAAKMESGDGEEKQGKERQADQLPAT